MHHLPSTLTIFTLRHFKEAFTKKINSLRLHTFSLNEKLFQYSKNQDLNSFGCFLYAALSDANYLQKKYSRKFMKFAEAKNAERNWRKI